MACGVYEVLSMSGEVIPENLSRVFSRNYQRDPARGYGGGAHRLLQSVLDDRDWQRHSTSLFQGEGSFGNGGAMRSAPVGAFFAENLEEVVDQADRSAIVTHAHREGRAGAIAVALAAAQALLCRGDPERFRASVYPLCAERVLRGSPNAGLGRSRSAFRGQTSSCLTV